MSNETKIGLMATVVIAVFIWGYKFLQGKNLFSSNKNYYVEYQSVEELQTSSPIFKNGVQIGTVADINFKSDDMDKVVVTMDVDGNLPVPKDASAKLIYVGVMGGRAIDLSFKTPCSGANCAENGDYLNAVEKGLLGSLVDPNDIPAYMDKLSEGAKDLVKGLNEAMADPKAGEAGVGKILNDFSITLSNLSKTTEQLNRLMASSAAPLKRTLENVADMTGNLKDNNDKITAVLTNTEALTRKLSDVNIEETVKKTNTAIDGASATMADLKVTLEKANEAFAGINNLIAGIQNGDGTLGKLVKDEVLYDKLNDAGREVELLLQDIRLHPKRYTRILSKKEKDYVYPPDDPADAAKQN